MKTKKNKILFILLVVIIGVEIIFLQSQKNPASNPTTIKADQNQLQMYAQKVIEKCASSNYHPTCYNTEITALMDKPANLSMEDAFKVTSIVQDKDSSFPYCHVLGHDLSAKEVKKDPSKWKEVVTRCPAGLCSNGCIHGGFQERFRTDVLTDDEIKKVKEDLKTVCEKRSDWNPTGLEQASCYHALGHLTMYITGANIQKATSLCNEIALKPDGRDLTRMCFDGSFMQIFQPLEPEDFALIKGKEVTKATVDSFCTQFTGAPKSSCFSESWPLFREDLVQNPNNLVSFCNKEDKNEVQRCYDATIYVMTTQFNFDMDKIKGFCLGLPKDVQGTCFANAASRMIETDYRNIDKSADLCNFASQKTSTSDGCYRELLKFSTFNFHNGSEEMRKLCSRLPDPWSERCLNQIASN